jgi:hypothetical protein
MAKPSGRRSVQTNETSSPFPAQSGRTGSSHGVDQIGLAMQIGLGEGRVNVRADRRQRHVQHRRDLRRLVAAAQQGHDARFRRRQVEQCTDEDRVRRLADERMRDGEQQRTVRTEGAPITAARPAT